MRVGQAYNIVIKLALAMEKRVIAKGDPAAAEQVTKALDTVINHSRALYLDQIDAPYRG